MVYGDTNSTLAGALVASKLHIPVAHVEAGLRSFNMKMPEEINRILTDHVSSLLLCPTQTAVKNLQNEGLSHKPCQIELVGDVMQDSALMFSDMARLPNPVEPEKGFFLATIHRAENTDHPERLRQIVDALNRIHDEIRPVVLPLHPRTRNAIEKADLKLNVQVLEPVGFLEMLGLLKGCTTVFTDSGGLQKEAFFFSKPCVTIRDQTEWVELVSAGANQLVDADVDAIFKAAQTSLGKVVSDRQSLWRRECIGQYRTCA